VGVTIRRKARTEAEVAGRAEERAEAATVGEPAAVRGEEARAGVGMKSRCVGLHFLH